MPKKEVWLSEETLNDIRKILGIKPGEPDKGVSEYIRESVELRRDIEKYLSDYDIDITVRHFINLRAKGKLFFEMDNL